MSESIGNPERIGVASVSDTDRSLSIVMPAYNASATLPAVVDRIPDLVWPLVRTVWIVNDGSEDATGRVIEELSRRHARIRAVSFERNCGYGAAMNAGLSRARDEGARFAIGLHADGQYAPEKIPELFEALNQRGLDVVQGSRIASGTAISGGMPLYKFVAGKILTALENGTFGLRMTDYHSGYLGYSRRALERIPFASLSASFDFDLEAIACARAIDLAIGEIPIPTHYGDEVSYLNPIRYGFRVLRVLGRYRAGAYLRLCNEARNAEPT